MKTSTMVGCVVAAHAAGIGLLLLSQGCGTRQPRVEPPPAPVMPPRAEPVSPPPAPALPPARPAPVAPAPKSLPEEQLKTYVVRPGDSLSRIAQRFGVSTHELIELNKIDNPNRIHVGKTLLLPPHAIERTPAPPAAAHAPARPAPAPAGSVEYRVMPGDSLSRIAQKFGVKVSEIIEANGLGSDRIRAGDRLIIPNPKKKPAAQGSETSKPSAPAAKPASAAPSQPSPAAAKPATSPAPAVTAAPVAAPAAAASTPPAPTAAPAGGTAAPLMYTVHEGDTLQSISKTFLVSVESLRRLNNLGPSDEVRPGQRIQIPLSD